MQFINPYNFIRLKSLKDGPSQSNDSGEKITGVITYTLKTKSRLFIPNTSSDNAFSIKADVEEGHKRYDFFSYQKLEEGKTYNKKYFKPIIPGSEVRGMVRSIYETLTNSCLPILDGETRIAKRTVETFQPGILRRVNGKVFLYPAEDLICRNKNDFSEKKYAEIDIRDGSEVTYKVVKEGTGFAKTDVEISEQSNKKGWLVKGRRGPDIEKKKKDKKCDKCNCYKQCEKVFKEGKSVKHCFFAEKHSAHIFKLKGASKNICEFGLAELEDILGKVIDIYQENGNSEIEKELYKQKHPGISEDEIPKPYAEYKAAFEDFCQKNVNGLPVYYSDIGGPHVLLSPACITREVYQYTEEDLVKNYCSCGKRSGAGLCPACQLFGIVGKENTRASKIRFADLRVRDIGTADGEYNQYYNEELLTMEELSVPKLGTTEFYLQQPQLQEDEKRILFWTYEYYIAQLNNNSIQIRNYIPEISGRKFYWHNFERIENCEKGTKRNRTVRTVKEGVVFTGKLYFDQITKKQLDQLLYIIQYGELKKENGNRMHGFKLGGGKPLGLGSVELTVESVQTRKWTTEGYQIQSYEMDFSEENLKELDIDWDAEQALSFITKYPETGDQRKIHYFTNEEREGFGWFVKNKQAYQIKGDSERSYKKRCEFKADGNQVKETNAPNDRRQVIIGQTLGSIMDGKSMPYLEEKTRHRKPDVN